MIAGRKGLDKRKAWTMNITIKKMLISFLTLIIVLLQPTFAIASNAKKSNPKKSNLVSSWILPSEKSKKMTVAQIGRTLPVKFRLVVGEQVITSAEAVTLKLELNSACTSGSPSTPVKTLVDPTVVRPTPTATSETDVEKLPTLRVDNGIFKFNWKIDKNTTNPGCYVLTAEKGSLKISSPIIKVRASK